MLHMLWREYAGDSDVEETLDSVVPAGGSSARRSSGIRRRARSKEPIWSVRGTRQRRARAAGIIILGMGKLGGRRSSTSRRISTSSSCIPGRQAATAASHSARRSTFTRSIAPRRRSARRDHCRWLRVSHRYTRCRPFGDSGPPVTSFGALESYLLQHGRVTGSAMPTSSAHRRHRTRG